MPVTNGTTSGLLQRTAVQSFWNTAVAIPDAFEGLIYRRPSTQMTDTYTRLGAAPMPQEWKGDIEAKVVNEYNKTTTNTFWESTVKIGKELIEFEQWDEIANLTASQGMKAMAHQAKLLSTYINNANGSTSGLADDGQYFADTDHADPGAPYTTSQVNYLTENATDGTNPTDIEMQTAVRASLNAFWGFKDDQGDPFVPGDDNPENFILMVPGGGGVRSAAYTVLKSPLLTGSVGNDMQGTFTIRTNPFMTVPTGGAGQMAMLYKGSAHKPFIIQEKSGLRYESSINGDEQKISGDVFYTAKWVGAPDYGQWRTFVLYKFT